MCVTPNSEDFESYTESSGRILKGLTKGAPIAGTGIIHWKLDVGGKTVSIRLQALHVPTCEVRLLSPQQLIQQLPPSIEPILINKDHVLIKFPEGDCHCPMNDSNLPVMKLTVSKKLEEDASALNACVMQEHNQNLTPSQKELLKWHCKLGHINLATVQSIMKSGALGFTPLIKAASNLNLQKTPLVCGSCLCAKAKRKSSRPKTSKTNLEPPSEKLLSKDILIPGQKVSMDHFLVST